MKTKQEIRARLASLVNEDGTCRDWPDGSRAIFAGRVFELRWVLDEDTDEEDGR